MRILIHSPGLLRTTVIALTGLVTAGGAASGLIYPSPYAPLAPVAMLAAVVAVVIWLRRPVYAMYAAVFAVLMPIGLIPASLQSTLNRSLTVIACVVWLVSLLVDRRPIVWTRTAGLMTAFIVWGAVSLFWAADLDDASRVLQTSILRLALFLVLMANEIGTKKDLDRLMLALALAGWLLLLSAGVGLITRGYQTGTRLQVLDMNENSTGVVALVTLIGVLWGAMTAKGQTRRAQTVGSYLFLGGALVVTALTGSRGSALSFVVALSAFWIWKPTRRWARTSSVFLGLLACAAPFVIATTLSRFAGTPDDTALGGREALWSAAWEMIKDHVWLGVGIGNSPRALFAYLGMPQSAGAFSVAPIHNPVLTMWADVGLPGLVLYLGVLVSAAGSFLKLWRRHSKLEEQPLAAYFALTASVFLGYLVSWIKGGGIELDFTYFLMLALLVVPSHLNSYQADRRVRAMLPSRGALQTP